MRIIDSPEIIEYDLLALASRAKLDPEYSKLIHALESKSDLPVFDGSDPLSAYGSVLGKLFVHILPSGKLVFCWMGCRW